MTETRSRQNTSAPHNDMRKDCHDIKTFPLGRISLGLLNRTVFNFIPKFKYFVPVWIIIF